MGSRDLGMAIPHHFVLSRKPWPNGSKHFAGEDWITGPQYWYIDRLSYKIRVGSGYFIETEQILLGLSDSTSVHGCVAISGELQHDVYRSPSLLGQL